jgi:hypothetical protein
MKMSSSTALVGLGSSDFDCPQTLAGTIPLAPRINDEKND